MKKTIYLQNSRANRSFAKRLKHSKQGRYLTVVLMTMPSAIHVITSALDMPRGNADRGVEAGKVIVACTANPWVPILPADIALATTHLTAYNGATPASRKSKWRTVNDDLKAFMRKFQTAADADPANAIEIIESGHFRVKQVAIPQNHLFEAKNSPISGRVDLVAEGGGEHTCHDWWFSLDGVRWERMTPTIPAKTFKTGLTPGNKVYFNHQLITKNGEQGLEGVIEIIVT